MSSPQRAPRRQQADSEVIARFREIAEQSSGLSLIPDDEAMSPDGALLDHCATALHLMVSAERASDARSIGQGNYDNYTPAMREEDHRLFEERMALIRQAKPIMKRIAKMPATTGAGIYAKALIVRGSRTGAECLLACLRFGGVSRFEGEPLAGRGRGMSAPDILQDDAALIEAERQLAERRSAEFDEDIWPLVDTISLTPPRTLAGAAVKLRLLCDEDIGILPLFDRHHDL